jgi:hypothetical protein
MSRFNVKEASRFRTTNLAGGDAFEATKRWQLLSILFTSFLNDKYYRTAADELAMLKALVADDPLFAAKAAVFARHDLGMRSITHAVAGELSTHVSGTTWGKNFYQAVVRRPDDILEILAYLPGRKSITNAMRKGLGLALTRFDAYQLGKYKGKSHKISLIDAVNLLHPQSTPALSALMDGSLAPPNTWEVRLTQAGSDTVKKAAAWGDLVNTDRLGYMAMVRNLKNIKLQAHDSVYREVLSRVQDPVRVKRSLLMPFRYYVAIKRLQQEGGMNDAIVALSNALDLSVHNIPDLEGRKVIVIDRSGSMNSPVTLNKSVNMDELACLFGFAMAKKEQSDVFIFGDEAMQLSFNPHDSLASLTRWGSKEINQSYSGPYAVGHGTNFHAALEKMSVAYDHIIYLSDMQGWVGHNAPTGTLHQYKVKYNAKPKIWSIDLTGYGSLQFPEKELYCIAGWSEKIFDLMKLLLEDEQAVIKMIEGTTFERS